MLEKNVRVVRIAVTATGLAIIAGLGSFVMISILMAPRVVLVERGGESWIQSTFHTGNLIVDDLATTGGFAARIQAATAVDSGGVVVDYNPPGLSTAYTLYITPTGTVDLTGLLAQQSGREIQLCNVGATNIIIYPENGNSSPANRFNLPAGVASTPWTLIGGDAASCGTFWYNGLISRWQLKSWGSNTFPGLALQGDVVQIPGNYTSSGVITPFGYRCGATTSPAALAAGANGDIVVATTTNCLYRLTADASNSTISGISVHNSGTFGTLCNVAAAGMLTLLDDVSTPNTDGFLLKGNIDRILTPHECVQITYDPTGSRWVIVN
jgi:hypothetical protein